MNAYEMSFCLPISTPLYSCTTDQLIGCLPAATIQTGNAWYWMHALELTVLGTQITVRNSGWRANPCLQVVEMPSQDKEPGSAPDAVTDCLAGAAEDPLVRVLAWLRAGYYVAFCGALPSGGFSCTAGRADRVLQAGVIYGARNMHLTVLFCDCNGLLRRTVIPFEGFAGSVETGNVRALRGVRFGRAIPFAPAVTANGLARLLLLPDREEALRLLCAGCAGPIAWRMLRQQRFAVAQALAGLGCDPTVRQAYLARVAVPYQTLAAALLQERRTQRFCLDAARLRWIWAAEREILSRAVAPFSSQIGPICRS